MSDTPLFPENELKLSYDQASKLTKSVMEHIADVGDPPIPYAITACILATARYLHSSNPTFLTPEEEQKFLDDISDWLTAYWPSAGEVVH